MKVEIKKLDRLKRVIRVDVDEQTLNKDKAHIYQHLGKTLKVPGFRAGTAPLDILEKHHGKLLKEKFLEWALGEYYNRALKEHSITPVTVPRIFDVEFSEKKLSFSAELEIQPWIDLDGSEYKGIKIKTETVEVTENEWQRWWENFKSMVKNFTGKDFSELELAKWAGYPTLEALKDAAKVELKSIKLKQRRERIERHLKEVLLKRIKVEVPRKIVEETHQNLINQRIYTLRLQGISEQDLKKHREELEEKLKPLAEEQVKLYYILNAIAEKENLKVDNQNLYQTVMPYILTFAEFSGSG